MKRGGRVGEWHLFFFFWSEDSVCHRFPHNNTNSSIVVVTTLLPLTFTKYIVLSDLSVTLACSLDLFFFQSLEIINPLLSHFIDFNFEACNILHDKSKNAYEHTKRLF